MREFTNPKAKELIEKSCWMENYVREYEQKNCIDRENAFCPDFIIEMMSEAAGLRCLADDLEDGLITEEELEGA